MRVGIDIIENKRINKILRYNTNKIFTKNEIEYCKKYKKFAPHFASIWCAKEAVCKATQCEIKIDEIEILHNEKNYPYVFINNKIENYLKINKLNKIEISISNEKKYSIAICIIN